MTDGQTGAHRLSLEGRAKLAVTAVSEVVSFDEDTIVLRTDQGTLVVQGRGLQLKQLTLEGGSVAVEGQIDSLVYEQDRPAGNLWHRLFR